jgi:hypothetical protein
MRWSLMVYATPQPARHTIGWPEPERPAGSLQHFRHLPTELRLKVWRYFLPAPQNVRFNVDEIFMSFHNDFKFGLSRAYGVFHGELLACRESWELFRDNYRHIEVRPIGVGPATPLGYFDSKADTLIISVEDMQILDRRGHFIDVSHVEKLALGLGELLDDDVELLDVARAMCPRLRSFTHVLGEKRKPVFEFDDILGCFYYRDIGFCGLYNPFLINMQLFDLATPLGGLEVHNPDRGESIELSSNGKLQRYIDRSNVIRRQHRDNISSVGSVVEFKVAMLAKVELVVQRQRYFLVPRTPQPYHVYYPTSSSQGFEYGSVAPIPENTLLDTMESRSSLTQSSRRAKIYRSPRSNVKARCEFAEDLPGRPRLNCWPLGS